MSHKKLIAFIILINYFQIKVFCFVDINSVQKVSNISSVVKITIPAKTRYKLTWANFFNDDTNAQLVVALPPQLRLRKQLGLETRLRVAVDNSSASVRIRGANGMHRGFYSAFKVINDSNQLYLKDQKDFYFTIEGLAKYNDDCLEDSDCESNYCLNKRCFCTEENPVPIDRKCYSAQPIGSKCLHSSQCKPIGGPSAECGVKSKCRCVDNSRAVEIPMDGKHCVQIKDLYSNCTYSEQCRVIEIRRYCAPDMTCQCLPNHIHHKGVGCVLASEMLKSRRRSSAERLSSYVWPLLVITISVQINTRIFI